MFCFCAIFLFLFSYKFRYFDFFRFYFQYLIVIRCITFINNIITRMIQCQAELIKSQGCFMNYPWADLTYCILAITSLILFLIHWSCKKAQINSISLYRTFFQRYSFYIVNRDWLCLETHTVPAKRHCHKSSPSFLSLYLPDPSRTLPDAGCCMRIF